MPTLCPKEEKSPKLSAPAFSRLPLEIKLSMMGSFLSTKELGQFARVNNDSRTLATQCDNKEYLALTKGQKLINTAKRSLKPLAILELLTLNDLENRYGLLALGEELLTLETIKQLKLDILLKIICTPHGLTALREKLISLLQAKQLGGIKLRDIFTENGLAALREKLVTPEQAKNLNTFTLQYLLSDKGIFALRNRTIDVEQAEALDIPDLKNRLATVNLPAQISIRR